MRNERGDRRRWAQSETVLRALTVAARRRLRPAVVGVCLCAGLAQPIHAQVVVVLARGPSAADHPAGSILGAGRVLQLKTGDRLEVLDGAGSHVITGPGAVVAGRLSESVRTHMIEVFIKGQRQPSSTGVVRGSLAFEAPGPGNLWQVDASQGGTMCVLPASPPTLWREEGAASGAIRITRVTTGRTVALDWPAGAPTIAWPAGFPVSDAEPYRIVSDEGPGEVHWKVLPATPAGLEDLARQMLAQGCTDQLQRLQAVVATSASSP